MKKLILLSMTIVIALLNSQLKADVIKTVGASGADFATLKAAFTDINSNAGGIYTGIITLQIVDNTTETVTAQLSSSNNWTSVNIYPTSSGKNISGNISGSLITLTGANNVTIDGRLHNSDGSLSSSASGFLTISNTMADATATTIKFEANASYNNIKYCMIKGSGVGNANGTIYFATSTTINGNGNNTISNNLITNAGGNRPVYSIFSSGSVGFSNSKNSIINNEFADFLSPSLASSAIRLSTNTNASSIIGNSFYETTPFNPTASVAYGIIDVIDNTASGSVVSDNYIGGSGPECSGSAWSKNNTASNVFSGIVLISAGTPVSTIQNNTIKNINWSNSANSDWTGIYVSSSAVNVTGNTIGASTGVGSIKITGAGSKAAAIGISFNNSGSNAGAGNCNNNKIGSITTNGNETTLYGIYCGGAGTSFIKDNLIGSTTTANSMNASSAVNGQIFYGVRSLPTGTVTIKGNTIANISNAATYATINGILINSGTSIVDANFIYNFLTPNSNSTAQLVGISIGNSTASSISTYSNNIISLGTDIAANVYGIYENNTVGTCTTNVYFNTVNIKGAQVAGSTSKSFCFRSINTSVATKNIKNNIFASTRSTSGVGGYHFSFYAEPTGTIVCDYNDYFFSGEGSLLCHYGEAPNTGVLPIIPDQDVNSQITDPVFTNASGTTAISYKPTVNLPAVSILLIPTDYFNNTRSATPKMGAVESTGFSGIDQINVSIPFIVTSSGIKATFDNEVDIELYTINGILINKTKVLGTYSHDLKNGMYIIRINDKSFKFIK